jgi:hypothetical protein
VPDIHGQKLQHARDARANMQGVGLAPAQLVQRSRLLHVGLLGLQPRSGGIRSNPCTLGFQLDADFQLFFAHLRELLVVLGTDAFLVELVVHIMLQPCLFVIAAHAGLIGLLGHQLAVHLHSQVREIRFGAPELVFGVE